MSVVCSSFQSYTNYFNRTKLNGFWRLVSYPKLDTLSIELQFREGNLWLSNRPLHFCHHTRAPPGDPKLLSALSSETARSRFWFSSLNDAEHGGVHGPYGLRHRRSISSNSSHPPTRAGHTFSHKTVISQSSVANNPGRPLLQLVGAQHTGCRVNKRHQAQQALHEMTIRCFDRTGKAGMSEIKTK